MPKSAKVVRMPEMPKPFVKLLPKANYLQIPRPDSVVSSALVLI